MKKIALLFLFLHISLFASVDTFFDDADPSLVHHVNVLSGHLNLYFEDAKLKSGVPFSLSRTFSSSGALERSKTNEDLKQKKSRGSEWMFQGGWTFLPHAHLLLETETEPGEENEDGTLFGWSSKKPLTHFRATLRKKSGQILVYSGWSENPKKATLTLLEEIVSTGINPRQDPQNSQLKIEKDKAILSLPDGSKLQYQGNYHGYAQNWMVLTEEILPSKHVIQYHYIKDGQKQLRRIELQSPDRKKIFGKVLFKHSDFKETNQLQATTSDGVKLFYKMLSKFKNRSYLTEVKTDLRPIETIHYGGHRKGTGARFQSLDIGNHRQLHVTYYTPPSREDEKKWKNQTYELPKSLDKVHQIQFPSPETGELKTFAEFSYEEDCTKVLDFEGLLTCYYHDGDKLLKIEYFDKDQKKFSEVEFEWTQQKPKKIKKYKIKKPPRFTAKKLSDGEGNLLLTRTFSYDRDGNLLEDKTTDHQARAPPICRRFEYYPKTHLTKTEQQVGGLSYEYRYLYKTNLVESKFTKKDEKILLREFTLYDSDNFEIRSIKDDGSDEHSENLKGVTERHIEEYTRYSSTGLIRTTTKKYLNIETGKEETLSTHRYTYSNRRDPIREEITYCDRQLTAPFKTHYNNQGKVIEKISPLERVETFNYDSLGRVKTAKTIGQPERELSYDFLHRSISCLEGDKTSNSKYDRKGRLLHEIDPLNNPISQSFDQFGRCTQTSLPEALDENQTPYTPIIHATYDLMGNLTSHTNPKGETTTTLYNALRKPVQITHPDGAQIRHTYHLDGSLTKTENPDGSETLYTYDPFQRATSKKILSKEGELLSSESWEYTTFHLIAYTNPTGLRTEYRYNRAGQKIAEITSDRSTQYAYDPMGNLERLTQGGFTFVTKHNIEGEVEEEWVEGDNKKENHTFTFYNNEGQKEKAIRITSLGEAEDLFFYDTEGRLTKHVDPNKETSEFLYTITPNELGQKVEQKTTIDPLGLSTVETFDANGRLVVIEKLDQEKATVAKEELFYDRAGNRAKRITTIYDNHTPTRTHTTRFVHDERGRAVQEIEQEEKETHSTYDAMGRLVTKILPSKVSIHYTYDPLGRLLSIKSSDNNLHYTYSYDTGPHPIQAIDQIHQLIWERTYTPFGEIASERRPDGLALYWSYDNRGRCTHLLLPDHSSIAYEYRDLHLHTIIRKNPAGEIVYQHTYAEFDANGHVAKENPIYDLPSIETSHDLLERPHLQTTLWHKSCITYGASGLIDAYENSLFGNKDYAYDPLNQLIQEGETTYSFDSLGNPKDANINHLNQILFQENTHLLYDENGNPVREDKPEQTFTYGYDPFNRLNTITESQKQRIQYIYDPFNRLYCKNTYEPHPTSWTRKTKYYLYNHQTEIGTLEEDKITQLKIVGLGLLGEIGATVAIELNNKHYLPLHDFCGNVIALISSSGSIVETLDIDAFGKALKAPSINPWRFNSKRSEEHLVFYGNRFYSPFLGRFLNPDPAGTLESPNLYLFVRNSPLNRLDLFGLFSQATKVNVSIDDIKKGKNTYHATIETENTEVETLVHCFQLHKINFSPEEISSGLVNLLDHFGEIFSKEGMAIGLVTYANGICTNTSDLSQNMNKIAEQIPGTPMIVGLFNETQGLVKDLQLATKEMRREETPATAFSRQIMTAFAEALDKVNANLKWLHICHSGGGGASTNAIRGMGSAHQDMMKNMLLWLGVAPSRPHCNELALDSFNFYSENDHVTGPQGRKYQNASMSMSTSQNETYNIKFLKCSTPWREKTMYFTDHSFSGSTYQDGIANYIEDIGDQYGFYQER